MPIWAAVSGGYVESINGVWATSDSAAFLAVLAADATGSSAMAETPDPSINGAGGAGGAGGCGGAAG